ncbi:MAG: restriction endonuclease subunit S [Syntrophales bacterium]|jgi:type I restriction enzyme S subunit
MNENRGIPKGWTTAVFENLLNFIQPTKFIVASTEYDDKNQIPVLTAGKSFILGKTNESDNIFNEIPVIIFDDFTTATKFVNFPFKVKSSAMKILSPASKLVNIKYLFYYMQTLHINAHTHKRYWISHYSKLSVPFPPLLEQHRIVAKIEELFSELDKGVDSLKTAQQQLTVYRQAVLKWAFEGKLTNKNMVEGQLPHGWKWVKISDISNVVRGGSPRPAGDPKYYDGNIPFLKVADITRDNSVFLNTFNYTIKEAGLHKTRKISPNTLLLSNSGATLGVPKICMIDATMNDGIAAFLNLDERSNLYLYYFWLGKTRELRNINMGAAQPNLNTDILKNYMVPYCSFAQQKAVVTKIETRLSVADKIEETISQSLQQAEALRQSILKRAFEGKLVPQDPNDEPAQKLLERIRAEKATQTPEKKTLKKKATL